MGVTRGKIHKDSGKDRRFPAENGDFDEEKRTETLQKFYVNCTMRLLRAAGFPDILFDRIPIKKGGAAMMVRNARGRDDVDDLIFTDAGWEHSER